MLYAFAIDQNGHQRWLKSAQNRNGNRLNVDQRGANQYSDSDNPIVINQSNSFIDEIRKTTNQQKQPGRSKPGQGNQVSLRVDNNTQTTISQHNRSDGPSGPNSVELWQSGNSETTINQSSGTHENTVVTHPYRDQPTRQVRPTKRRNRP